MITHISVDGVIAISKLQCDPAWQPQIGNTIEYIHNKGKGLFLKVTGIDYKIMVTAEEIKYYRIIYGESQS